jgi:hypothetical protein
MKLDRTSISGENAVEWPAMNIALRPSSRIAVRAVPGT